MSAPIPASQVKELRDRTGAGMMDSKNALVETGGDIDKAASRCCASASATRR